MNEYTATTGVTTHRTVEDVAMGFIKVANEAMCRPIRALTQVGSSIMYIHILLLFFLLLCNWPLHDLKCNPDECVFFSPQAKGYDTSRHVLACFGGAGGQHACAIARSLGMATVFVHRYVS